MICEVLGNLAYLSDLYVPSAAFSDDMKSWCRIMSYVLTSKCPIDLALSVPVKQEGA